MVVLSMTVAEPRKTRSRSGVAAGRARYVPAVAGATAVKLTPVNGPVHRDEDISEVAQDVVFIHFRYYDGSDWMPTWDSAQMLKLPKAVEVTVYVRGEWRDEEVIEPFMTRFYLPVGGEQPAKTQ